MKKKKSKTNFISVSLSSLKPQLHRVTKAQPFYALVMPKEIVTCSSNESEGALVNLI